MIHFLIMLSGLIAAVDSDEVVQALLTEEIPALVARSLKNGDTRPILIPYCAHALPGEDPRPYMGEVDDGIYADYDCAYIFGTEGRARLKLLGEKATEYNDLLVEESSKAGMFRVYPPDAIMVTTPSDQERAKLNVLAQEVLGSVLGNDEVVPRSWTFWRSFSSQRNASRLFLEASVDLDVEEVFEDWRVSPVPVEMLGPLHMSPEIASSLFKSYIGNMESGPAYALYSESTQMLIIVAAIELHE